MLKCRLIYKNISCEKYRNHLNFLQWNKILLLDVNANPFSLEEVVKMDIIYKRLNLASFLLFWSLQESFVIQETVGLESDGH